MSEWHKQWQAVFPIRNREVSLPFEKPCHRADILAYGYVIEFQHSPLSMREFHERNEFYTSIGKKVIWVFDVHDKYENGSFTKRTPNYVYNGTIIDAKGKQKKKWIINEFRIGTTFVAIGAPPDLLTKDDCIGYTYGRNEKSSLHQLTEWYWDHPFKTLDHYNPQISTNIAVFLEFEPNCLQKIVWCQELVDEYQVCIMSERMHDCGIEYCTPSVTNYKECRDSFVIKSNYKFFTSCKYTKRDFLIAIKEQKI